MENRNRLCLFLVSVSVAFMSTSCADTARVVTRVEYRGCTTLAMCDDGNPSTVDYCTPENGNCHHERVIETTIEHGCLVAADCDDHDAMTTDECVDRVCHHIIDRTPMYDPESLERQNATFLCEEPREMCPMTTAASADLDPFIRCSHDQNAVFWREQGYPFWVRLSHVDPLVERVHVWPQLRDGSRADT